MIMIPVWGIMCIQVKPKGMMDMELYLEKRTSKSFEEALVALRETLKERQFGVLWELNFRDKFAEKGFEYGKNHMILEVCNPKIAIEILNAKPDMAYFLPCKMMIRDDGDSVVVGMIKPEALVDIMGEDSIKEAALMVEKTLWSAIEAAV